MCHYKATEGPNGQVTYKSHERPHSRTDNVHAIRRQQGRIEEGCGAYGDGMRGRGGSVAVVMMHSIEHEVEAAAVTLWIT